jgi:integrase
MALFLDHGLRVGELVGLTVVDLDLKAGELRFYREKVDVEQTHRLSADALRAARAYLESDALPIGPLLRSSRKDGRLHDAGMSKRAIMARVRALGEQVGIEGLSPHDCRHYWATQAARGGTPLDRLQDAGGWASPAMPLRYVEAARIANEGVQLG